MLYFWQGLTMGLAYSAPIGLQNLFIINSALTNNRRRALLTALIVFFFDITLSLACFFGIGVIMQRHIWLQMLILLLGSLLVIYIGIGLLRAKAPKPEAAPARLSIRKTISSACAVTWFNPQAIIDGTMMLGAFQAALPPGSSWLFITGVQVASCLWFTSLTLLIGRLRSRFNSQVLRIINLLCGIIIIFYGGKLLYNFWQLLG